MQKYVLSTGFTCFSMQNIEKREVFIVKKHIDYRFYIKIGKTGKICIDSTITCCVNRDQWGVTIYIYMCVCVCVRVRM